MIRCAFTLIELLVVITIIVVLLALLTPALDKAIYQATATVCAAQMKSNVQGATQYAFANRRSYFYRPQINTINFQPRVIASPHTNPTQSFDDRPMLKPYIPLDQLKEPFLGDIKLEIDETDADTITMVSYNMWWGFGFSSQDRLSGEQGSRASFPKGGMFKVGNRLGWHVYKFNVLITDVLRPAVPEANVVSSHPPRDGRGDAHERQDGGISGLGKYTIFNWDTRTLAHAPLDQNAGWQDGSVRRYQMPGNVEAYVDPINPPSGYEMRPVPWVNNAGVDPPPFPMGTYYMIPHGS